jgi:hypothetical protein
MSDEEIAQKVVAYLQGLDDHDSPYVDAYALTDVLIDGRFDLVALIHHIRKGISA